MTEDSEQRQEQEREDRGARQRMGDGLRSGIGVLSAFKDALEETIHEARERGDLSADRAKELVKGALNKAQAAAFEARERLDFANQSELEDLQNAIEALGARVAALEERVFGDVPGSDPEDAPEEETTAS